MNLKILNIAFWIEIILAYVLPFKAFDNFRYEVGFPISFITVYDKKIGINPLMSMSLNPLVLVVNIFIIYVAITVCIKIYSKYINRYSLRKNIW